MGLNSFLFVLFVAVSLFIYYVIPKKIQWLWLLVISYVYYITNSRGLVVFITATTLTTWYAGLTLEKTEANKKRRLIVALTLLFNFGILAVLKYTNFFIANINVPHKHSPVLLGSAAGHFILHIPVDGVSARHLLEADGR